MAPKPPKQTLFDDSEDESDGGAKIKVNKEYAKRFEHNKKREERQRLEEKYKNQKQDGDGDSSDSSSDETEDEDGFLATEDLDAQISATLEAIRKKDPRIYDGKTTFYKPIQESDDAEPAPGAKKEKPVYLQDYHRQRILAGDTGADEEQDAPPKTYVQEQDEIKQSFANEVQAQMQADDGSDSEDDFLKAKEGEAERVKAELKENSMHPSRAAKVAPVTLDVANAHKNPEEYLSNFMAARAWKQPSSNNNNNNGWEAFESDDDEDVGKADEWEAAYNLRFEDPNKSNEVLKSYARDVADAKSVRREDKTARKRQREQERAEKEAAKQERKEERARLRKLRIEEAEAKLKQIKKAAGVSGKTIKDEDWVKFLNDEWDNEKWQEEMTKAFGDQYYAEGEGASGDEEAAGGSKKKVKKPKWDDDIDIKDLVPDFDDDEKPQTGLSDAEAGGDDAGDEDGEGGEDEDGPASKRQKTTKDRKREKLASQKAARQERAKIEALVDAKMDIDEPEALAGSSKSKTDADIPKFSYRETWPESYGLTARDILMAPSDAALNEFAGLKKLAHFRPADKRAKDKKRLGKKARLREWRRETFGPEAEKDGPEFSLGGPKEAQDEEVAEESNIIEGSKKRKRRSKKKTGE